MRKGLEAAVLAGLVLALGCGPSVEATSVSKEAHTLPAEPEGSPADGGGSSEGPGDEMTGDDPADGPGDGGSGEDNTDDPSGDSPDAGPDLPCEEQVCESGDCFYRPVREGESCQTQCGFAGRCTEGECTLGALPKPAFLGTLPQGGYFGLGVDHAGGDTFVASQMYGDPVAWDRAPQFWAYSAKGFGASFTTEGVWNRYAVGDGWLSHTSGTGYAGDRVPVTETFDVATGVRMWSTTGGVVTIGDVSVAQQEGAICGVRTRDGAQLWKAAGDDFFVAGEVVRILTGMEWANSLRDARTGRELPIRIEEGFMMVAAEGDAVVLRRLDGAPSSPRSMTLRVHSLDGRILWEEAGVGVRWVQAHEGFLLFSDGGGRRLSDGLALSPNVPGHDSRESVTQYFGPRAYSGAWNSGHLCATALESGATEWCVRPTSYHGHRAFPEGVVYGTYMSRWKGSMLCRVTPDGRGVAAYAFPKEEISFAIGERFFAIQAELLNDAGGTTDLRVYPLE